MWRMEKCFGLTLESATKIFSVLCILESLTMIFFSIITVLILSTVQGIEETVIWLKKLFNIVTEMETPAEEASFVDSVVSCSYANIVILVPELIAFLCLAKAVFCSKIEQFIIPILVMIPVSILKTFIISISVFTFLGSISIVAGIIWIAGRVALWLLFYSFRGELREENLGDKWEFQCPCYKVDSY